MNPLFFALLAGLIVTQIVPSKGGRVAWSHTTGRIYFDRQVSGNLVLPFVCNPDGSDVVALTLPKGANYNVGNPAISQDDSKILLQVATASGYSTNPGIGAYSDIYLGNLSGATVTSWKQLTFIGAAGGSVLHPKFSPDGTKIAWTQSSGTSQLRWELVWANSDGSNIQESRPGNHGFYELGSWGLDSKTIYMVETDQGNAVFKNIYSFDTLTGAHTNLTNVPGQWFEFPQINPDGKTMAYVSSVGTGVTPTTSVYLLDLWVASTDGLNPVRVTDYNLPGQVPQANVTDIEWNTAGTQLVALIYEMPHKSEIVSIITP